MTAVILYPYLFLASIIIPLPIIFATWPSHTARSHGRLFLPV